ncbi:MAG: DUF262 domain-containing protein [Clostridium sp.]|nr:DUF262 domain-containing protein [Clostridium sp.]
MSRYQFNQYNDTFYTDIPLIQRDYVQGADRNSLKRDGFLHAILRSLAGKGSGKMDFIYGTSRNDSANDKSADSRAGFTPIDGQQRLTTLSLIGWLLAQFTDPGRYRMPRMSYHTRSAAEQFCDRLFDYHLPEGFNGDIGRHLRREPMWMSERWLADPSVNAMIDLLSAADRILSGDFYRDRLDDMARRFFEDSPLEFELLDMKKYSLTEDLYIKMNARGKHLSQFENWKAEFTGMLRDDFEDVVYPDREVAGHPLSIPEYFSHAIEHDWTDLLWPAAFARWDAKTDGEKRESAYPRIDEQFMALLDFLTRSLFYEQYPLSATWSDSPTEAETEAADPARRFEGDGSRWLPARRVDIYRRRAEIPGRQQNVIVLFRFFDTLCEIARGEWNEFFDGLLYSGPWDPESKLVNLFDEKTDTDLFGRCLRGDLRLDLAVLLRGILFYCDRFGVSAPDDRLLNFTRVFRGWILSHRQRLAAKIVGVRDNFRVDDFPAMAAVLECLTADRDVYIALEQAGQGDMIDPDLAKEIKKARIRSEVSADVVDRMSGCEYLKGDFSNLVEPIRRMAGEPDVLFGRFVDFYLMDDRKKTVTLLRHGWHGEKVHHPAYRFFGMEGHWDYVFTTSGLSFRQSLTRFLCGEAGLTLSPLTKEYYLDKYDDFYEAHRWEEDPSHFYYIASDFVMTTLLARFTCRLPVYQQCPYAYTLFRKLERENRALCEKMSLTDSYESSDHGCIRMNKEKYWLESVEGGWRFDFTDGQRWHSRRAVRFDIRGDGLWNDKQGVFSFRLDPSGYNIVEDLPDHDHIESAATFLEALYDLIR